jgi:Raf kinase inhibitor-like YbhB/YbcL family protein
MTFRLRSDDISDGKRLPEAQVFNGMGYAGGNISPHLAWEGAPEDTRSFVVTVYDPDAPTGSGWWHWVVANIPADVTELPRGAGSGKAPLPQGAIQSRTDFGAPGYGGAAPPPGAPHRYIFSVHALKVPRLEVDAGASGAMVGFMVNMNSLDKASLTATYGKSG